MTSVLGPHFHAGSVLAAVALASCTQLSPLRSALDDYSEATNRELAIATEVVLDHIPLGTEIEEAKALLKAAGFDAGRAFDAAAAESVGYSSAADRYIHFSLTASTVLIQWTTYSIDLGVKDGLVEFLNAQIRVESL